MSVCHNPPMRRLCFCRHRTNDPVGGLSSLWGVKHKRVSGSVHSPHILSVPIKNKTPTGRCWHPPDIWYHVSQLIKKSSSLNSAVCGENAEKHKMTRIDSFLKKLKFHEKSSYNVILLGMLMMLIHSLNKYLDIKLHSLISLKFQIPKKYPTALQANCPN